MDRYDYLYRDFVESGKLSEKHFLQLVHTDPTTVAGEKPKVGRYTQWLIAQSQKAEKRSRSQMNLFFEELVKYDRIKGVLPTEFRDIMKLDTIRLKEVVALYWEEKYLFSKKQWKGILRRNHVRYLYEDERYDVVVPLSEEASHELAGPPVTKWCTAVKRDSHFMRYHKQGPLYIIRDKSQVLAMGKAAGEPRPIYQVHLQSSSFYDHEDVEIDFEDFLNENEKIKTFFRPYFLRRLNHVRFSDYVFIKIILNVYPEMEVKKILLEKLKRHILKEKRILRVNDEGTLGLYIKVFGYQNILDIIFRYVRPTVKELSLNMTGYDEAGYEVPDSIVKLSDLEVLRLNGFVKNISKRISELKKLYVLSLCRNKVKTIPESIRRMKTLEVVHITDSEMDVKKEKFNNTVYLIQ